jgi:hypothetical protein
MCSSLSHQKLASGYDGYAQDAVVGGNKNDHLEAFQE